MTDAAKIRMLEHELLGAYRTVNRYRLHEIEELKDNLVKETGEFYNREDKLKEKLSCLEREVKALTKQRIEQIAQVDELKQQLLELTMPTLSEEE